MKPSALTLLEELLSQPTVPFREVHVLRLIRRVLGENRVPFFEDRVGNLVVGAASAAELRRLVAKRSPEPLRLFIAHTDHPGFHGVKWRSPLELEVKWHGGTPVAHTDGATVWVADSRDFRVEAINEASKLLPHGKALEASVIRFGAPQDTSRPAASLFGAFSFRAPVWREDQLIYTKAADDLIGVYAILTLALERFGSKAGARSPKGAAKPAPFIGLLSRAEEVGFIGAIGHFELGLYKNSKRPLLCVSLETSRTLPGADIGKGPVVRLGDRSTVFHSGSVQVFSQLAREALPDRHQRRIMDGGSCEATAATAYGLPTVGISVPLGNYHNQSFQGGPDSRGELGPAPEFVHEEDLNGMITLCRALLRPKLPWSDPWSGTRTGFKKALRGYSKLLKTGTK